MEPSAEPTAPPREPAPRARRAVVALAGAAGLLALAIPASRPHDGALLRHAATGSEWAEHAERVNAAVALRQASPGPLGLWEWFTSIDAGYPPLVPAASALLGGLVGHEAVGVQRLSVLWLLVLAAGVAGVVSALARRRDTALVAGLLAALLPAANAVSVVYAYDLPSTALCWLAAGALAQAGRRPVAAGAAAGLAFGLACLAKWSALLFGPPLLLGVLLLPRPEGRGLRATALARAGGAVLAAGVAALLLDRFLAASAESWFAMLRTSFGGELQRGTDGLVDALRRGLALRAQVEVGEPPEPLRELHFYALRAWVAVFSPAPGSLLLLGVLGWVLRRARGAAFVAVALLGELLVCLRFVPLLDERWLLAAAPLALVPLVLAAEEARAGPRVALLGLPVLVALLVCLDFHHRPPRPGPPDPGQEQLEPWRRGEGLRLASSTDEVFGWLRHDRARRVFLPPREAVWNAVDRCGASVLLVDDPWLAEGLHPAFWHYRNQLHALRDRRPLTIDTLEERVRYSGEEQPARPERTLAVARRDRPPGAPSLEALLPGWRPVRAFPSEDADVVLLRAPGSPLCTGAF